MASRRALGANPAISATIGLGPDKVTAGDHGIDSPDQELLTNRLWMGSAD